MVPDKAARFRLGRSISTEGIFSTAVSAVLGRVSLRGAVHPRLMGTRVYLRHPIKSDYAQWTRVRADSAGFLKPWEPIWPRDDLTPRGFRRRLDQYQRDRKSGRSLPYLIFDARDNRLLGGVNVSNIRRGICQTATIGYWMGADYAGQGNMSAALALLLPYLFDCQGLHRVEAACLPSNNASIAVLRKAGFQMEGKARSYLCINGAWEDHLLFSALRSDVMKSVGF
ncbi:GNAT family protein [uncultured Cohaesibacter sp.]|uniref:GNAT family N-acetyltransferase n=1 Tax=uncultured Cohaesibacter sp. TaxID=1002546 RepID=UPI0029C80E36|nr:GNAT family protein [uncultured Cohaesibacter sp.]